MRKIIVHNPCNEHTRYFRMYNLFWDELTEELKRKGIINSYEDDNTEETFFLTEEGKKILKENGSLK